MGNNPQAHFNNLIEDRAKLLNQFHDVSVERANILGQHVKRSHYAKTIEDRDSMSADFLAKSLDYAQQIEDLYSLIVDIDTIIVEAVLKDTDGK